MEKDNKKKEKARKIEHLGLHEDGFWVWGNGILDIHGEMFLPDCLGNVCVDGKLYNLPWARRAELDIVPEDRFCASLNMGDLSTWSSMMRMTYGDRGIVAVGYALAAIFKDLCDELAMRFPILYICGMKGNGKTRLASSLMALMGRPEKGPDLSNMTKGYMNRWLGLMKNGYVHIDEFRNNERASLISMLRRAPEERDCGLILCGQERDLGCAELNKSAIILYSDKYTFSTLEDKIMQVLRAYEYLGLSSITNRLQGYRSREFAAKIEECYWFLYRTYIPRFIDIREIDTDMLRCWCLVPAVSLALRESGAELAWVHSKGMSVFMDLLVEQARWINGINGGDGVDGINGVLTLKYLKNMEEKRNELYAFLNKQVNQALALTGFAGGYANGYVALPPTHPFYNVDYSETDEHVSVHGGLTFGQSIDDIRRREEWVQGIECIGFDSFDDIPAGYWVVGFDTMHYGDEGLNRDWCIEETLRLKNQLEALTAEQPSTAAGDRRDR